MYKYIRILNPWSFENNRIPVRLRACAPHGKVRCTRRQECLRIGLCSDRHKHTLKRAGCDESVSHRVHASRLSPTAQHNGSVRARVRQTRTHICTTIRVYAHTSDRVQCIMRTHRLRIWPIFNFTSLFSPAMYWLHISPLLYVVVDTVTRTEDIRVCNRRMHMYTATRRCDCSNIAHRVRVCARVYLSKRTDHWSRVQLTQLACVLHQLPRSQHIDDGVRVV